MVSLALFQPDQPLNCGTILRMAACLDVPAHIIEPCGFPFSLKALKRSGLDYVDRACIIRHESWPAFHAAQAGRGRLLLLTTKAATRYTDLRYRKGDILLFGQESAGAPDHVHAAADHRLVIPMAPGTRSLNIAVAAAMVVGEALRQTDAFVSGEGEGHA